MECYSGDSGHVLGWDCLECNNWSEKTCPLDVAKFPGPDSELFKSRFWTLLKNKWNWAAESIHWSHPDCRCRMTRWFKHLPPEILHYDILYIWNMSQNNSFLPQTDLLQYFITASRKENKACVTGENILWPKWKAC